MAPPIGMPRVGQLRCCARLTLYVAHLGRTTRAVGPSPPLGEQPVLQFVGGATQGAGEVDGVGSASAAGGVKR